MLAIYMQMLDTPEKKSKLEQLYIKHRDMMFYVANNILHNTHDAEDAVHQAFVSIAKNIDKIGDPLSARSRSFVRTVAENKAIDIIRLYERKPCIYMSEPTLEDATTKQALEYCKENTLSQCILRLPARYQEIILLKYCQGYSYQEISQILDITEMNTYKLLHRAKKKLYDLCKEENLL